MRGAWRQFHGAASNLGWKLRDTGIATRTAWRLGIGNLGASPVVDSAGTIYLASAEGQLIAVDPDGTERWRRSYGNPIIAPPAIAEDGSIYFITNTLRGYEEDGDGESVFVYRSFLMKANPLGGFLWSFELPDDGFTSGAPKIWAGPDGDHVVVSFTRPETRDGELCVIDPEGRLRARAGGIGCPWPIDGTPGVVEAAVRWAKIIWEGIKDFPTYEFDTSGIRTFPQHLDPTPAITDASNLVDDDAALIAIADNLCNLAVYRYDGARLERVWHRLHDLEVVHGSPVVTVSGHLIIGNEKGKVTAFHVQTGKEDWTYDAGEAVFGIPASFGMTTYVLSEQHIHLVHTSNGHEIDRHRLQDLGADGEAHVLSSPAVSMEWVHVAHDQGLTSYELNDLHRRSHDVEYRLGALSPSPAIGPNGELYVVHDGAELWAYPAP